MANLIPIIGLEIHVRLKTKTKMFCGCANIDDSAPVNSAICPVCTGQPGALPALNLEAVHLGVRTGLALECRIPDTSHFDRKNYFYPDLPKGYQISQYDFPISEHGVLVVDVPGQKAPRNTVRIGITRAHLEEDAAKNIHDAKTGSTIVNFNRAGQPLLEIVTEPDFRSPAEAKVFLQELQAILRAANVSLADMEKGFMRCDANISLLEIDENNQPLKAGYNPKTEVKNLNSFRSVERALEHEIERHEQIYATGETPKNTTRGWDENKGETFDQRSKETSADYRFFPEPDLRPLSLADIREKEKGEIPELPAETRARLRKEFGFTEEDAIFLVANAGWANYAEDTMGELGNWLEATDNRTDLSAGEILSQQKEKLGRLAGSWLTNKLAAILGQKGLSIERCNITPENFSEFLHLLYENALNSTNAQKLLLLMVETGADPSHILEEHNLGQMNDPAVLATVVTRVLTQNPAQAEEVRAGKTGVVKWFVGAVMKATEGRANPMEAEKEILRQIGA
ncbi:Asp-tRNA(Asn)/Glu-tRNA(Gln) amidotransferase GatCAB subunit B [Candidatus Uhrbacteria bacterium CG22_combo_CG10-13_8_21_14_all_47_17]|uniref:Aspartyl/glutamyl-tRNA(Asn/Gln) amidotransferase subunit B n=1 Tax=Candidatus Uhrbacteria bacterium CG22_combo_CG10-13_8_21_14_all_47_17 TaxID=1975041 RepID=A0A2H0BSQ4_9BACT|nr:MAG: Asp-tRNA(Asn)/Glu-tRNA(Gln) amidotransferase GatCAB subunit B [Candidatus Uhrbacteria bacterium CG22_combo_CG10-13_8_21_14_all_47_17]